MAQNSINETNLRDRWLDRITGGAPTSSPTENDGLEVELGDDTEELNVDEVDIRERLTDTLARNEEDLDDDDNAVGEVLGSATGEEDRDPVPGGWEGTDDATSTAPSDLSEDPLRANRELGEIDPDEVNGRGYGGGLGESDGGIVDIKGSPVEDSRDWENDPPIERGRD